MKKTISIFGSTGSIGKNCIDVILNSKESYKIIALVANNNIITLIEQAKILQPEYVIIGNISLLSKLQEGLKNHKQIRILAGQEEIEEIAKIKCDLFISAIVGMVALKPTLNAIKAESNIGLANKECLVAAGDIILNETKKNNIKLIPIDSEHNAIFQVLEKKHINLVDDIILTASGGPFLKKSLNEIKYITVDEATNHPNWSMGAKISVDSATMMNKGLEIIEAYKLFPIKKEQIKIVIHPQSIIHGIINYKDGSTLAMMSNPDMRTPISYAIGWPNRIRINHNKLNLTQIGSFDFLEVDHIKFPAIKLAKQALHSGGNVPCILNAANEVAVQRFLAKEISFIDIINIVQETLNTIPL